MKKSGEGVLTGLSGIHGRLCRRWTISRFKRDDLAEGRHPVENEEHVRAANRDSDSLSNRDFGFRCVVKSGD